MRREAAIIFSIVHLHRQQKKQLFSLFVLQKKLTLSHRGIKV